MNIITWALAGFALIGVVLNIRKRRECFYIWSVTNAAWAVIDFLKGIPAQGALFAVYFLLSIYGIYEWRTEK